MNPNGPETPLFWRSCVEDFRHILDALDVIESAFPAIAGRRCLRSQRLKLPRAQFWRPDTANLSQTGQLADFRSCGSTGQKLPVCCRPSSSRSSVRRSDVRLGSFAKLPLDDFPASSKLVEIIRPPLCHADSFVPMGTAVVSCPDLVFVTVRKRSFDRVGMPQT